MVISECLDMFIGHCKLRRLSEKTIENYDRNVSRFIEYIGDVDVSELDIYLVNKYIGYLVDKVKENNFKTFDCKLSKASIGTYLRELKVFIKYLEDEDIVSDINKKIKLPKQSKKLVKIYSNEEIQDIFNAVGSGTWLQFRNRSMIALFLDSGLRLNEVIQLNRSDLDFRNNCVKVQGKGDKERLVPIGYYTKKYIMHYLNLRPLPNGDDNILFITKFGDRVTIDSVKMVLYRLNDKLGFKLSPHKLRHNFATNYCINQYKMYGNVDLFKLMYLLGHNDTNTTRRYLHLANQVFLSKSNVSNIDSFMKR